MRSFIYLSTVQLRTGIQSEETPHTEGVEKGGRAKTVTTVKYKHFQRTQLLSLEQNMDTREPQNKHINVQQKRWRKDTSWKQDRKNKPDKIL